MKIAKRLIFVVGFIPFVVYAELRWIATGKSALDLFMEFEQWRDA